MYDIIRVQYNKDQLGLGTMTFRDRMENINDNLGWCKPYIGQRVAFVLCENNIVSLQIDGQDILPEDKTAPWAPQYSKEQIMQAVSIATNNAADPDDPDAIQALISGDAKERPCNECPWFYTCDAMDDETEEET